MTRRLRGPETRKTGKVKRFLRYTALTAGLMLGCAGTGKVSNQSALDKIRPPMQNPTVLGTSVKCKGSKTLKAGQEFWFGLTWRAMAGMRVINVGEKSITVDVKIPQPLKMSDDKIETLQVRVNGVEIPWIAIGPAIRAACSPPPSDPMARSLHDQFMGPGRRKAQSRIPPEAKPLLDEFTGPGHRAVKAKDDSKAVAAKINKGKLINMVLLVSQKFDGPVQRQRAFVVKASTKTEFLLRVKGGKHDGKSIRLDRRLTVSIETVSKKTSVVEVPYIIDSLTSDSKGNLKVALSLGSKTARTYDF